MIRRGLSRHLPLGIAALLVLLLAVLAALQWRWIGEVSEVEQQRMRASLMASGSRFTEDFDREVTRAFFYLHPYPLEPLGDRLERVARQYARWLAEAPYPGLVRDVFHVSHNERGGLVLKCLRPETERFDPCPWPAELEGMRRHLLAGHSHLHGSGHPPMALAMPAVSSLPGLVIPLPLPARRGQGSGASEPEHLIVRLDERVIAREILPALTRRYFGSAEGLDYALAVVDGRDPQRTIFLSDPQVPAASFRAADVRLEMFALRPFEELQTLWVAHHQIARRRSGHHVRRIFAPPPEGRPGGGGWQLLVRHRDGSLEQAVAAVRHRNLVVSLGVLALLAATMGLLVAAAQRTQRLARQQIEFVAGVTHELNTPLTAMRSAGQNLADGVVTDPGQVRRYGVLIESEGRRLSNLVGQALEFAGIQSGRRVYHPRPVSVEEVLDGALDDCRWLLEEKRIAVEKDVSPGLPPVLADPAALRRAVQNLVENAVKYGGREGWIGLRARSAPSGEVEITVADRGPGVRREDLPRIFEPFYRGREAAAGNVPGSGLGLSLVRHVAEAHCGRVTVAAGEAGRGSAFTLHLPAAPAAAAEVQAVEEPA
ncbi:MAG TPA: HAMP domain-containing sensor histidine kinase [Thermoanaerobaculia bacterium]|jgi:signal transduction histidine kinase